MRLVHGAAAAVVVMVVVVAVVAVGVVAGALPDPGAPRAPAPGPVPGAGTHEVAHVVDGDTVALADGERVRLVGIDTPERGECGYEEAAALVERLVLGRRVTLTLSEEDRDSYGRLLRYVDVGSTDVGLELLESGLAEARYDSRDGYGRHPREDRYVRADERSADAACPGPPS